MFENMGDMSKMLEQVQEQAKKMEAEMESKEYTAKVGGGMLEIKMSGKGEVIDINIDNSLLEDKSSLQIMLISCINDANKMVEKDKQNSAMGMLGGMGDLGAIFGNK
ncbi:MAG: nucleoid-associated protein, YbaB/EbfC family [Arcobacter sp.]|nr:MAG: nucleoid-associated protein, YbaB/EbfC family [Arcobacter sp.]